MTNTYPMRGASKACGVDVPSNAATASGMPAATKAWREANTHGWRAMRMYLGTTARRTRSASVGDTARWDASANADPPHTRSVTTAPLATSLAAVQGNEESAADTLRTNPFAMESDSATSSAVAPSGIRTRSPSPAALYTSQATPDPGDAPPSTEAMEMVVLEA
jgi:hypothetical protein